MAIGKHIRRHIGLSLSFCIKDILQHIVPLRSVAVIIAGTKFPNIHTADIDGSIKLIMNNYYEPYWHGFSRGECEFVLRYLLTNHMVVQPRELDNGMSPNIAKRHWLTYPTNEIIY